MPWVKRSVTDLKPNIHNAKLFAESLTEASIRLLADDMAKNEQMHPILALESGTIVDGERRWRAAMLLGWETVEVTTVKVPVGEILGRVLGSVTAIRHMTLREQVSVYKEYRDQLQREHGRPLGRPSAEDTKQYMTTEEVKLTAMKLAHVSFRSTSTMDQLYTIFKSKKSPVEVQERVNACELSISKGYEMVKAARAKGTNGPGEEEEIDLDELMNEPETGEDPTESQTESETETETESAAQTDEKTDEKVEPPKNEKAPEARGAAFARLVEKVGDLDVTVLASSAFPTETTNSYVDDLLANDPVSSPTGEEDLDALLAATESFTEAPRKSKAAQSFDNGVEALWTLESPEAAIKRLADALEASLDKLNQLDADRTRLCVRRHVRTVMIRIGTVFSK